MIVWNINLPILDCRTGGWLGWTLILLHIMMPAPLWCSSTHCGLMMPYGDINLCQHWPWWWLVVWQHQPITRINDNISSVRSCDIHLRAISKDIPQPWITDISLKLTQEKFCSNLPGTKELITAQWLWVSWAPSQYPKRRLFVRSREVSNPRDWYFKLSYRFEIWQAHRQPCCRSACQISERSDNSKYKSRGFETLQDLMERRLFGYWDGASRHLQPSWWNELVSASHPT